MSLLTSKKAIFTILSISSIVLAGTIKDINSRTVRKSQAALELELAPVDRGLASDEVDEKFAVMKIVVNADGLNKINSAWEITRIKKLNQEVLFDKINNPEDAKKISQINLELIDTGTVKINKDNEFVYKISMLSQFDNGLMTIALFKIMSAGVEIIEARKIVQKQVQEEAESSGMKLLEELVLERALNQAKSPKILTGDEAVGEMVITDKSIEGLKIDLKNGNGEDQSVMINTIGLQDGGSFNAEVDGEEVSGVVFNNGKDGYRLSFVTGPLAGAMLNFVTKEEMARIEEAKNDTYTNEQPVETEAPQVEQAVAEVPMTQEQPVEQISPELYEEIQAQVLEERAAAANDGNSNPVEVLSAEQIKETAETQGFSF